MQMPNEVDVDAKERNGNEDVLVGKCGEGHHHLNVLGKRRAKDTDLNDDDRFAKRLLRLSLSSENDVARKSSSSTTALSSAARKDDLSNHTINNGSSSSKSNDLLHGNGQNHPDVGMSIDDTPHRVYIHNLDDELVESDHDEPEKLVFLPDIDRYFSQISKQMFTGDSSSPTTKSPSCQEMVLYSIPQSLTVDEEKDNVRRAIIEARHRALDKAVEETRHDDMRLRYARPETVGDIVETAHGYGGYETAMVTSDNDFDMMDMD